MKKVMYLLFFPLVSDIYRLIIAFETNGNFTFSLLRSLEYRR